MHHVVPFWTEESLQKIEVASVHDFAPWELGHVGAKARKQACGVSDIKLTPTTRPIAWTFQDPNVPPEVSAVTAGPVQCIKTNGDGLCSVHSVFGVVCNTGRRNETELYLNDAKAFIRQCFGMDFIAFSQTLDSPDILAQLVDMMWFDLIRPACLRTLGLSNEPLTAETSQVWKKVSTDVRLFQRCINEVNEQQTAKEEQNQLRQAIVQAFSKICVESCEEAVIRPLLAALDLLEEFECESPYYMSESNGQLYITFPSIPAPMIGPATKYQALFDERPIFQKFRVELLERYGARMEVFRDKFLDVIQGLDLDGPMWGDVCQVGDLLNELQDSISPVSYTHLTLPTKRIV